MKNKEIVAILRELADGDKLNPCDVVDAARPVDSPLHSRFTWNDGEAAEQYRLIEARKLITVHVEFLKDIHEPSPVWVSLRGDRVKGGGYRTLVSVLSKKELREKLLEEALDDLRHFQEKYGMLKELAAVFAAIRKLKK